MSISYVFPNTSEIPQRGGLAERWKLAEPAGCAFVEVPADLIKNKTETAATGQDLCTFLSRKSIETLYKKSGFPAGKIHYILHTEPSLGRTDGYGVKAQAAIKWYDREWTEHFIRMVIDISDFLGMPAAKIEIHPGDKRNSYSDIVAVVRKLQERYSDTFGMVPEIILENRTDQFIASGADIARFRDFLMKDDPWLLEKFGIVLDIQQLSTKTKQNFLSSFHQIPDDCLKGFHIHRLHRLPASGDGIPWEDVFRKIAGIHHDIIINPEIHHNNKVAGVIGFCNEMLRKNSPQ